MMLLNFRLIEKKRSVYVMGLVIGNIMRHDLKEKYGPANKYEVAYSNVCDEWGGQVRRKWFALPVEFRIGLFESYFPALIHT